MGVYRRPDGTKVEEGGICPMGPVWPMECSEPAPSCMVTAVLEEVESPMLSLVYLSPMMRIMISVPVVVLGGVVVLLGLALVVVTCVTDSSGIV